MLKLVSIVMPAFNAEKFIVKALESVRSQSYSNWEIIVINDGGTDSTPLIVTEFSGKISQRMQLLEHAKSLGPSAARNTGMKAAEGEFIAFLDADDFWTPDHLENAVKALSKSAVDLVYADAHVFREIDGEKIEELPIDTIQITDPARDLFKRNFANTSGTVITHRLMEKVGDFDETLWAGEEWDYWIRATTLGFKMAGTKKQTYYYRKSGNSLSAASARMAEGAGRIYQKNQNCGILPKFEILAKAKDCFFAAGKLYWRQNPLKARRMFYQAWKLQMIDLKVVGWLCLAGVLSILKKET